jgi:hypothetical protein
MACTLLDAPEYLIIDLTLECLLNNLAKPLQVERKPDPINAYPHYFYSLVHSTCYLLACCLARAFHFSSDLVVAFTF